MAGALGPTIAAAVIVSVWAVRVARASVAATRASTALQRALSAPRLSVRIAFGPTQGGVRLLMELLNSGQTFARVRVFNVLVDGVERPYDHADGSDYWLKALTSVGLERVGSLIGAMFKAPAHIPGGSTLTLVSAVIEAVPEPEVRAAIDRIAVKAEYATPWGEILRLPLDEGESPGTEPASAV